MEKLQTIVESIVSRLPYFDSQAVLIALIAGWITGAIWYMVSDSAYQAATKAFDGERRAPRTQIRAGIAQAIMTIMLAMIIHKLGAGTLQSGVYIAIMMWFGFVMTTMIVNHSHLGAPLTLTLVDGIHWLLVLTVMGGIIGTMTPTKEEQAAGAPPAVIEKTTEPTPAATPETSPETSDETSTQPSEATEADTTGDSAN